jgi:cobalt ECF transporter T component CbiQ
MPRPFERTLDEMAAFLGAGLEAEKTARRKGLLQAVDPRARLLAAAGALAAVAFARHLPTLAALFLAGAFVAWRSAVPLWPLLRRVMAVTALFSGVAALPAILHAVTPGPTAVHLPGGWAVTTPGLVTAGRLVLRSSASVLITLTLVSATPWHRVMASLRALGTPAAAVHVLGIGYRYVFLLLEEARSMLVAREARRVGRLTGRQARREMSGAAGALMARSLETAEEVHRAMQARGFTGDVRTMNRPRPLASDAVFLFSVACLLAALLVVDRGL